MPVELCYERTWAKALSPKDDQLIRDLFASTTPPSDGEVKLTNIRAALNHRGDLLATVLVQNGTEEELTFADTLLIYLEKGVMKAGYRFTTPALVVGAKVSTPWTFIFPAATLEGGIELEDWTLVMASE